MTTKSSLETLAQELEGLHVFRDRASGLLAVIAVDDTRRGPPRGGSRLRAYPDLLEAARDAARLARGMTYKFAVHGLPYGGGKAVLLQDEAGATNRALLEDRLRAYGACLERLGGWFATGPDFGLGVAEIEVIREVTPYALGEHGSNAGAATAAGVRAAMELALRERGLELEGARVGILGVGAVGGPLAEQLAERGARLFVAETHPERGAAARALGAELVSAEALFSAPLDVLAPCATGELFDASRIASLDCKVVAGAANDQLIGGHAAADALAAKGILYVPDFVANGGAAVILSARLDTGVEGETAFGEARVRETTERVLARARDAGLTPYAAALAIAEEALEAGL